MTSLNECMWQINSSSLSSSEDLIIFIQFVIRLSLVVFSLRKFIKFKLFSAKNTSRSLRSLEVGMEKHPVLGTPQHDFKMKLKSSERIIKNGIMKLRL